MKKALQKKVYGVIESDGDERQYTAFYDNLQDIDFDGSPTDGDGYATVFEYVVTRGGKAKKTTKVSFIPDKEK